MAGLSDVMDITNTDTSHPPTRYHDLLDHFRELTEHELLNLEPCNAACWIAVRVKPLREE